MKIAKFSCCSPFLGYSLDYIRGMIVVNKSTLFKQIVRALFLCTRIWGLFMVIQCEKCSGTLIPMLTPINIDVTENLEAKQI